MKQKIQEPKVCRNPHCRKELPHDHGRKDCNNECKNTFFNEKAKEEKKTIYSYERVLRDNEKHVKSLYANTYFREKGLPKEGLEGQGINLEVSINREEHTTRKTGIIWFGRFGVELPREEGKNYMLVERSDDRVPKYKGGQYV